MDTPPFVMLMTILLITFWQMNLSYRQSRHLRSHAKQTPPGFQAHISAANHRTACNYNLDRQRLRRLDILIDATCSAALVAGGIDWLWQQLTFMHDTRYQSMLFLGALAILLKLCSLPTTVLRTFWLEQKHGFNRTRPRDWLIDQLKQLTIFTLIGVPAAWFFSLNWQQPDATSVLLIWTAWACVSLLASWAYPTILAPLFYRFEPLQDQNLATAIRHLTQTHRIASLPVYIMNGSSRSSHGNAFFCGLGRNRRIVIFDTLLAQLTEEEIIAVLAHEIGHQHHAHLRKSVLLSLVSSLLFILLLWHASIPPHSLLPVDSHPVALAMTVILLAPYACFPLLPLRNYFSRRAEYQADSFAASIWPAQHLINALIKLYRDNGSTLHPDPLHSLFYDTHPSATLRINHLESKAHESAGNEMRSTAGAAKHR